MYEIGLVYFIGMIINIIVANKFRNQARNAGKNGKKNGPRTSQNPRSTMTPSTRYTLKYAVIVKRLASFHIHSLIIWRIIMVGQILTWEYLFRTKNNISDRIASQFKYPIDLAIISTAIWFGINFAALLLIYLLRIVLIFDSSIYALNTKYTLKIYIFLIIIAVLSLTLGFVFETFFVNIDKKIYRMGYYVVGIGMGILGCLTLSITFLFMNKLDKLIVKTTQTTRLNLMKINLNNRQMKLINTSVKQLLLVVYLVVLPCLSMVLCMAVILPFSRDAAGIIQLNILSLLTTTTPIAGTLYNYI